MDFSLTKSPLENESLEAFFMRFREELLTKKAVILKMFIFGSVESEAETQTAMKSVFQTVDWPITWSDGGSCYGRKLAGVQVYALSDTKEVQRIRINGEVLASVYEDKDARHCLVGGLCARNTQVSPGEQTQETFALLETVLEKGGFEIADIVRTWFYNDELLEWYDDFNVVRSAYYGKKSFNTGSTPASTAVYGKNPAGSALTLAAWAFIPKTKNARAKEVLSPLQCPAPAYGSAFSRAMEITSGGQRRITVSGTASIEPGGKTIHLNDIPAQVELSMKVIGAILHAEGMSFKDVTRATAYCKVPSTADIFTEWHRKHGEQMPVFPVHCDICRHDLLFELELDAVQPI